MIDVGNACATVRLPTAICDFDVMPGASGPTPSRDGSVDAPPAKDVQRMPLYDYECAACGPFSEIRPMAESGLPFDCPGCGASAPRVLLGAPGLATMVGSARAAMATGERSGHAPKRAAGHSHGASCGCSSHGGAAAGRRPGMLRH